MRDYSKIGPKFWIGSTGKQLREAGMEAQIVAMYLLSSPHANMLGLYYCPTMFIAHETGLGFEGASKGLRRAIEAGFCEYDEGSEVVWVIEMAAYQIGGSLSPNDKRAKGVQNEYDALPENPYLMRFFERYGESFCMTGARQCARAFEAPSKPLGSQEQEQEQEQEKEETPTAPAAREESESGDDARPAKTKAKRKRSSDTALDVSDIVAEGVDPQVAADWFAVRKEKRAPLTPTAWDFVKSEAEKAGLDIGEAVRVSVIHGWQGFKAVWLGNRASEAQRAAPRASQPADTRARNAESKRILGFEDGEVIDA